MAKRIQGITIEIDGNTTKLESALKGVNKTLYSVNSELKATEKALKLDPTNTDLIKQKMLLLSKAIQETSEKLKTLKEAQNQMKAKGIDENSEQFRTLTREISKTESSLKDLKSKQDSINGKGFNEIAENADKAGKSALKLGDIIKANLISSAVINGVKSLGRAFSTCGAALKEWGVIAANVEEQEQKFRTALKNTTDATEEDIQAYVKLAEAKEKNGVVSKAAILNGYQELATYTTQKESIEALTDAMLDMTVQQYGMNASEEQTLSIATRLGKALSNGDYSGLAKMGYYFTDAEKKAMKYGTEEDRVNALLEAITASVGGMNEALAQTNEGSLKVAISYLDDMKESLGGLFNDLKGRIAKEFLPEIQEISTALQDMVSGNTSIEDGLSKIGDSINSALQKVIEKLPMLLELGVQILTKIVEGIIQALPQIITAVNKIIKFLIEFIGKNLPKLTKAVNEIILELAKVIIENLPVLIETIATLINELTIQLNEYLPLFITAAVNIILALAKGLIKAIPTLIEAIPEVISSLVAALLDPEMLTMLLMAGIELTIELGKGLIKAIPDLLLLVPKIIHEILKTLSNLIVNTNWKQLGKNILNGILNGLIDFGSTVKNTITKLGKKITNEIKSFFGIHSPSTLMEDEIGTNLTAGIVEGMENGIPSAIKEVNRAMTDLNNGIQASVNPTINPTANSNPLYITIDKFYNNRDTDIQQLAQELEFYRKNAALAKGGM